MNIARITAENEHGRVVYLNGVKRISVAVFGDRKHPYETFCTLTTAEW